MKPRYLDMICNSDNILECIEKKIKEKEAIDEQILQNIISQACLERLYSLETINKQYSANLDSIKKPDFSDIDISPTSNELDDYTLSKFIDKIIKDTQLYIIIETIGKTGLSRVTELKDTDSFKKTFLNSKGEFTQGALSKKIQILEDLDVIDVEKITTGRKGGYENIYSLSNIGIQIYKAILKEVPIENEKFLIKKQYNSLEHGYFIKTVTRELKNKGYNILNKSDDYFVNSALNQEDRNKIKKEIDLMINKSNINYVVQCEMGTSSYSEIEKQLNRLISITNVISFVANNQDSLNKTFAKVDKWITKLGRENLKGYLFRFSTIDTLKKKEVWKQKGPF